MSECIDADDNSDEFENSEMLPLNDVLAVVEDSSDVLGVDGAGEVRVGEPVVVFSGHRLGDHLKINQSFDQSINRPTSQSD